MNVPSHGNQPALKDLKNDLPKFASQLLRIRTKTGEETPLQFNRAQLYLHQRLETQLREKGLVRALVLKGRQQGVSTYLQARFFWRIWSGFGKQALIMTHRQDASQNLFDIARRFLDRLPPALTPIIGTSNEKELYFDVWDSGYRVATAGARATGRSATAQLIHGSEVAYWPDAEDHMAGLGQTVLDAKDTEIILESTANGIGNAFHNLWQTAERGASTYAAVFIPWFWQEEYARPLPAGFVLTADETAYRGRYNLTAEQIFWRRMKIQDDFGGDATRFQVEYPANSFEAFAAVGQDSFIPPDLVLKSHSPAARGSGPLIVGVDPARFGRDATAIVKRRGRQVVSVERLMECDTMNVVGRIVTLLGTDHPERVFIDSGGLGAGIYDRLVELGYADRVTPIQFGEKAIHKERYVNRRSEMWGAVKEWLRLGEINLRDDRLTGELSAPQYGYDSEGRLKLESKDDMRARGVASPDIADALALTFALPLPNDSKAGRNRQIESLWQDLEDVFDRAPGYDINQILPGIHTG